MRQMFQPFRFSFWWRMAVLGIFTGEITGGGGGVPGGIPGNGSGGGHPVAHPFPGGMGWFTPAHILEIALVFVLFVIFVSLIFVYISSILRFVLFDAVLMGHARIREGWRKWREAGRRFFGWNLALLLIGWMCVVACIFLPAYLLFTSHHWGFWYIDGTAIGGLALGVFAMIVAGFAMTFATVLAKDFVVPIMALDDVGWQDGWRRFLVIARDHWSEYVLYLVMKILLRIGIGMVQGAIGFIVSMIVILPAAIFVGFGVAIGIGAATVVKALLITAGIVLFLIVMLLLVAITALIGAPVAFFFPAYAIYFFAGRYEALGRIVFPAPAPPIQGTV